jgi:hypothetical protein
MAAAKQASSSGTVLAVAVEVVGVSVLAIVAGASDAAGKMIVLFMVGLWLVFMVTNPGIISTIASFPEAAAKAG